MREIFTSGSVGGLVEQSLTLPGLNRNIAAGDANRDGEFNSADIIQVLAAGKYELASLPPGKKATGTATAFSTPRTSFWRWRRGITNRGRTPPSALS